jgi:hypothetical protein
MRQTLIPMAKNITLIRLPTFRQRRVVYATVIITVLFNTAYFFFCVFQCGEVSSSYVIWEKFATGKCVTPDQILGVSYAHAGVTAVSDWTFAILPIAMVKDLCLERKEKTILAIIIIMGTL